MSSKGMSEEPAGYFSGKDGAKLAYWCWEARDPKAVLVGLHGACTHARRLRFVAEYLQRHGYTLYAYDQRGHGTWPGLKVDVESFQDYLDDLYQACLTVRERHMDKDIFLLGHSMGGLICLAFAINHPNILKGVVVSSPWLATAMKISGVKLMLGKLVRKIKPTKLFTSDIPQDLLTHDREVVASHEADPLRSDYVTARWYFAMLEGQKETISRAGQLRVPCLIMQAGDDRITDAKAVKTFYDEIAITDKTYKEYRGFYHELFNEVDREIVFRDVVDWLDKHISTSKG